MFQTRGTDATLREGTKANSALKHPGSRWSIAPLGPFSAASVSLWLVGNSCGSILYEWIRRFTGGRVVVYNAVGAAATFGGLPRRDLATLASDLTGAAKKGRYAA